MAFTQPAKLIKIAGAGIFIVIFICTLRYVREQNLTTDNRVAHIFNRDYSAVDWFFSGKRNRSCSQGTCVQPYNIGKEVLYENLDNCRTAKFIPKYSNPCWIAITSRKLVCAPRIYLLGFHKCGTSDLSKWLHKHSQVNGITYDVFKLKPNAKEALLTEACPLTWVENDENLQGHYAEDPQKTAFDDCPACSIVSKVVKEDETSITRVTAIQYLSFIMMDNCRFIVTMREPADRMISHFFYMHKMQTVSNPYRNKSVEQIGGAFFHKIVSETTTSMRKGLELYGTTVCALEPTLCPIGHPNPFIIRMLLIGCYSTMLREVFKFIPKEKIFFSKLEDYSLDRGKKMKEIFQFVGLPFNNFENQEASDFGKKIKNQGYDSKPVDPATIEVLKAFYEPFNIELSQMLGDDTWLWR